MYWQFNILQFYLLHTQCIYVFCVELRTNSDYFMIAITLYFRYQQIELWIFGITHRYNYYGQLHGSANNCICEIWQKNRIFYASLYFIFKLSYICLLQVQTEVEKCIQAIINTQLCQIENCNADCSRRRYPIQVQYSSNRVFRFLSSFLHQTLCHYPIYNLHFARLMNSAQN
jgi:hypothetical protein